MWRLTKWFKRRKYIEVELDFPDHLQRQPGETNEQHLMRLAIGIHEAIKQGGFIDPDMDLWEDQLEADPQGESED